MERGLRLDLRWRCEGGKGRGGRGKDFFFQAEDGIRDYDVTGVQDVCSSDLSDCKAVPNLGPRGGRCD